MTIMYCRITPFYRSPKNSTDSIAIVRVSYMHTLYAKVGLSPICTHTHTHTHAHTHANTHTHFAVLNHTMSCFPPGNFSLAFVGLFLHIHI